MYQSCEVHWKLRNGEVGDVCWLSRLTAGARLPRAQVLWYLSELGTWRDQGCASTDGRWLRVRGRDVELSRGCAMMRDDAA